MNTKTLMIATLLPLGLFAAPASAQEAMKPAEKVYCQSFEMTGSRVAKRICLTAKEWKNRHGVDISPPKPKKEASVQEKAVGNPS
jgi:hypothetical protein